MAETTIIEDPAFVTFINVFTVQPERQAELLARLTTASTQVMRHLPGFVSGNFHASTDGTKVINYVQWETEEQLAAAQTDPNARIHMAQAIAIATSIEPRIFRVAAVHHR